MSKIKLTDYRPIMGADPEFFLSKGGKVIGSEKVINRLMGLETGRGGKVIVDGVQVEFNPLPYGCREFFRDSLYYCFDTLHKEIKKRDKDISCNFSPIVKVDEEELKSLHQDSQRLGCAPSKNVSGSSEIKVDASKYLQRGAGGHIHISSGGLGAVGAALAQPERAVAIMDILVGNTFVLIDRDEGNIERRKVYGKAGEFRTPAHGLEYRTLSNFWLRSYPLMSFAIGLTRNALSVLASTLQEKSMMDFEKELLSLVKMEDIHKAINENNFNLAWRNYRKVRPFIAKYFPDNFTLNAKNLHLFEYFVRKGVDAWFDGDIMAYWIDKKFNKTGHGWELFLQYEVRERMLITTNIFKRMTMAISNYSTKVKV